MRELIVDNFAGGGGASTGIEQATGRPVDVAINHDPIAIAMHKANHPQTKHYNENVWEVDPREVAQGRPVALCWLSPDCRHFSKAKGGKPVEKQIRGLAWVAVRWAATVRPRVIILENVEEFQTWGPLVNGRPCPDRKGRTFRAFVRALERHGYKIDWRELRACDYGAPTIRKRLFLIARRDGRPIVWPHPTHGSPDTLEVVTGQLHPWRTAAEIIDWSLPCPSIFTRKRPLAENTLRRIARGIQRFLIESPRPFVLSNMTNNVPSSVDEPLTTILTGNHKYIVNPYIVKVNHQGETFRGQEIDEPFQTITAKNGWGLVAPFFVGAGGPTGSGRPEPADRPFNTVLTQNHTQLVAAFLTQYHTETQDNRVRGQVMDRPILTLDTSNRYGLVASHIIKLYGNSTAHSLDEPLHTVTAGPGHLGEVRAFLRRNCGEDAPAVVHIGGEPYQIADIGMRMLEPRELFAAQGFPPDYIIDQGPDGKRLSKSDQVRMCGNAVPPPFAKALVEANLPELCYRTDTLRTKTG